MPSDDKIRRAYRKWQRMLLEGPRLRRSVRKPVFVVGCQRSGTTMLLNVLRHSPDCRVYHENNDRAFEAFRLKDDEVVRELVAEGPEPVVVFKPLLDSQHTDRLASLDSEARTIWAYRHYTDVARSAVKLWGGELKNVVCGVAEGRIQTGGQIAMSEKLTAEARRMFDQFADRSISDLEGSLLFWYARNSLLFDLKCQHGIRVVSYEDLVRAPMTGFRRIFRFVDCRFRRRFVSDVHARSVTTVPLNGVNRDLVDSCDELLRRLELHARRGPGVDPPSATSIA